MPKVDVGGTELHYERAGTGEPLLLIQGMSGTHVSWGAPFKGALEEGFDVVAFDNRGIGLSERVAERRSRSPNSPQTLSALLDELGIESAHVVGISMGGMIAQELALAHPGRIRSLTLGCSYCGGPGSHADAAGGPAKLLGAAFASGDREQVFRASTEINLSPAFRADESTFAAFPRWAPAAGRETAGRTAAAARPAAHDTSGRLGQIAIPTLVVHGDLDRVLRYANGEQIAALIPDRPLRDARGRRSHVLVGAAAALRRAGPRARARRRSRLSRMTPRRGAASIGGLFDFARDFGRFSGLQADGSSLPVTLKT